MSLQAYCHHCRLPTFESHPKPDDCIAALRKMLEPNEVWKDNQRLQKAHSFAVGVLREFCSSAADEAVRIARGEG